MESCFYRGDFSVLLLRSRMVWTVSRALQPGGRQGRPPAPAITVAGHLLLPASLELGYQAVPVPHWKRSISADKLVCALSGREGRKLKGPTPLSTNETDCVDLHRWPKCRDPIWPLPEHSPYTPQFATNWTAPRLLATNWYYLCNYIRSLYLILFDLQR